MCGEASSAVRRTSVVRCARETVHGQQATVVSTKVVCDGPGDQRADDVKAATA
jgi:hypothetical protein